MYVLETGLHLRTIRIRLARSVNAPHAARQTQKNAIFHQPHHHADVMLVPALSSCAQAQQFSTRKPCFVPGLGLATRDFPVVFLLAPAKEAKAGQGSTGSSCYPVCALAEQHYCTHMHCPWS